MSKRKNTYDGLMMKFEDIVDNMDVMYRIKRRTKEEKDTAVEYMKELTKLIEQSGLEQVYFSPTEVIINAIFCYKDKPIDSEVDRKICEIIQKLGYM